MLVHADLIRRLRYEPQTGIFLWVDAFHPQWNGKVAGRRRSRYMSVKIGGREYLAHRLAWFYVHGVWPRDQIDHRDGDPFNNAIGNLREATCAENHQNRKVPVSSKAGVLGTTWHRLAKKWQASIKAPGGKRVYIGLFDSQDTAHAAYLRERARLFAFQPIPRAGSTVAA